MTEGEYLHALNINTVNLEKLIVCVNVLILTALIHIYNFIFSNLFQLVAKATLCNIYILFRFLM